MKLYSSVGGQTSARGISEPPRLANFLCGQLEGKKLGQMPSPTCGKAWVAHMGDEQMQGGAQNLPVLVFGTGIRSKLHAFTNQGGRSIKAVR
jgi:hypothetical protein